jgi:hypothetical protein
MTTFEKLIVIASEIAAEESTLIPAVPWQDWITLHPDDQSYYLCWCGERFTDIASKRAHQSWCQHVKETA